MMSEASDVLYIHVTKQITVQTRKIKDVTKLLPHFARVRGGHKCDSRSTGDELI